MSRVWGDAPRSPTAVMGVPGSGNATVGRAPVHRLRVPNLGGDSVHSPLGMPTTVRRSQFEALDLLGAEEAGVSVDTGLDALDFLAVVDTVVSSR